MKDVIVILINVSLTVTGQLLLKQGMIKVGRITSDLNKLPGMMLKALSNEYVISGIGIYAISAMIWLVILSRVKLSFAYPMVSFGYVLTVFFSWLLFKEQVPLVRLIGVFVICIGVYLVSRGTH